MKTENQVRERELATGDVLRVCLGDIEGAATTRVALRVSWGKLSS